MTSPIDRYLQTLESRLDLSPDERAAVLEEMRAHLEEKAASLQAAGRDPLEAEQTAIGAFGDVSAVARRISAVHPTRWNIRRWLGGMGLGALLLWVIWFLGSFPVVAYQVYTDAATFPLNPIPSTGVVLTQATPLTDGAFFAYQTAGWLWLAIPIIVYLALPFVWGMRARSWWAPGLAYGLGAWVGAPWFIMLFFDPTLDLTFQAEARLILVAAPLDVAASGVGALIERRRHQRLAQIATA